MRGPRLPVMRGVRHFYLIIPRDHLLTRWIMLEARHSTKVDMSTQWIMRRACHRSVNTGTLWKYF